MIRVYDVKNDNAYYKSLFFCLEYAPAWASLATKYESKSDKNEKGYQMLARMMVSRISNELNANTYKAEALSMCIGTFFPKYGANGLVYLQDYVDKNRLNVNWDTFKKECIEYNIMESGAHYTSTDLDKCIDEYFDDKHSAIIEVEIVKMCQDAIKKLKVIEKSSFNHEYQSLLVGLSDEVVRLSKEAKKPVNSANLDNLFNLVLDEKLEFHLSKKERDDVYQLMDKYIEAFGQNGIYKYVGSKGR